MSLSGEIKAMAAHEKGHTLKPWAYTVKPLGKNDVDIAVEYCGVCHSDVHQTNNDWGMIGSPGAVNYPIVPGHEAVGKVVGVGSDLKKQFKVGDTVGLGAACDACGTCDHCKNLEEPSCNGIKFTYAHKVTDETGEHSHYGGFGTAIRTPSHLVYKIPDGYDLKYAGPLLCAGITTYRPLVVHGAGPGKKVAIVGVGGLGHMAVQYSKHLGAETTAVSSSADKEEFAKSLGAHHFINSREEGALEKAAHQFDLVLITISANIDMLPYINLVAKNGTVCFVGLPTKNLDLPINMFIFKQFKLTGSAIGGTKHMDDMLAFSAKHDIKPIIEEFPMSKAQVAFDKVLDNSVRFRAVLKNDL